MATITSRSEMSLTITRRSRARGESREQGTLLCVSQLYLVVHRERETKTRILGLF